MQQLLKPELVRLMDDDEQRLIVFRRDGAGFLKRQQLLQVQITSVRKRRHVLMLAATACRFNPPRWLSSPNIQTDEANLRCTA
jgi:hypothetical protein